VLEVRQPEIEHKVRIRDFENWLDSAGRSPAEMALKSRLRIIRIRSKVAFFFKQWGARTPKAGSRLLAGREWNQFPSEAPKAMPRYESGIGA
jgi:hypothetical protein